MSEEGRKIRVAITQGDINGIGCEVIMKTLSDPHVLEICTPVIYSSARILAYYRKALNLGRFNAVQVRSAEDISEHAINLVNCLSDDIRVDLGKSTEMGGQAALASLKAALTAVQHGEADVLLTAPINKNNIQTSEFQFPGHTEFLSDAYQGKEVLMMMVSDYLKVGTVTGHIPLSQVASSITTDHILSKLRILNQTLVTDFTILQPKIAVLSLNPHGGDEGLIGHEEKEVIQPAIATANANGILAFGPFAADGFFGSDNHTKFDAVLAMYHEQAMIPFKIMSFEEGVNFTAGLPIVRTSPAHGTAYDIAGKNEASCNSFKQALYMACDVFHRRKDQAACLAGAMKEQHLSKKFNSDGDSK